jgi:hypothetical protein
LSTDPNVVHPFTLLKQGDQVPVLLDLAVTYRPNGPRVSIVTGRTTLSLGLPLPPMRGNSAGPDPLPGRGHQLEQIAQLVHVQIDELDLVHDVADLMANVRSKSVVHGGVHRVHLSISPAASAGRGMLGVVGVVVIGGLLFIVIAYSANMSVIPCYLA